MPSQTKPSKAPKPDANGWTKGAPSSEGAFWFCVKNDTGEWHLDFGTTYCFDDRYFSDLKGGGFTPPEELKSCYHKPAELPDFPVAILRRQREVDLDKEPE